MLQIWDLGGQQSLRPFWATYYKNCDAVIMVVDSTDRARVGISKVRCGERGSGAQQRCGGQRHRPPPPQARRCGEPSGAAAAAAPGERLSHDCTPCGVMHTQAELMGLLESEDLARTPILVLANKQDLKDAMTVEEMSTALSLHSIRNHDWHIQVRAGVCEGRCRLCRLVSEVERWAARGRGLTQCGGGGARRVCLQACCALTGQGLMEALAWVYQRTRPGGQQGAAGS